MKADKISIEFSNLEIHMGDFRDTKFKMKGDVHYDDNMLVMDGGNIVARLHARNIGNCHLEKKAIRIAAMNFEIKKDEDVSVATGSIRLEVGKDELRDGIKNSGVRYTVEMYFLGTYSG